MNVISKHVEVQRPLNVVNVKFNTVSSAISNYNQGLADKLLKKGNHTKF